MELIKLTSVIVLIGLFVNHAAAQEKKLKICIEDKVYIPYLDKDLQKAGDGLLIQIVGLSAKQNQLHAIFIRQSWPRCLSQVVSGEVDALMPAIYTSQRAQKMVFPKVAERAKPQVYLQQVRYPFFIKKGQDFSFTARQQKLPFGIGAPYQYVSYQMLAQHNLLPVYDYDVEAGLAMVAAGRLDAYVVETLIGLNSVTKLQLQDEVIPSTEILLEGYWHIAFNPEFYAEHSQQVDGLWANLEVIRDALPKPEPKSKNSGLD